MMVPQGGVKGRLFVIVLRLLRPHLRWYTHTPWAFLDKSHVGWGWGSRQEHRPWAFGELRARRVTVRKMEFVVKTGARQGGHNKRMAVAAGSPAGKVKCSGDVNFNRVVSLYLCSPLPKVQGRLWGLLERATNLLPHGIILKPYVSSSTTSLRSSLK